MPAWRNWTAQLGPNEKVIGSNPIAGAWRITMDKKQQQEIEQRLRQLLVDMDLPRIRVENLDLGWLDRNLWIRNGKNPNTPEAMRLIKSLILRR